MSNADDGFLTEPLDYIREVVRQKYADLRSLLVLVNRAAVANQHLIEIHLDNNVEKYAATLYARTLASTQASVLLLDVGLVSQAQTLLRSAMETYFALAAIAKKPSVVSNLRDGHIAEQNRAAKNLKLLQHPVLKQIADETLASDQFHAFNASTATTLPTFDLAKKAGLEDWYRTVYMVFSWSVHGAAVDLDRHIVIGEGEEVTEFRNEPEIDSQELSWSCAIEILLKATAALTVVFPNVEQGDMEQQYAELHTLAAKFPTNPTVHVDSNAAESKDDPAASKNNENAQFSVSDSPC